MKQRVYIETTIPSFYHEVRSEPEMVARRAWTREWWDEHRHAYGVTGRNTDAMRDDPAIETVRDVRRRISQSVGHDPRALVDYYRQLQSTVSDRVVERSTEDRAPADDDAA